MRSKGSMSQAEYFQQANALLKSADFPGAIKTMHLWSKFWLNHFVQVYPESYPLLKQKDFEIFWQERRAHLSTQFAFVKQNKIADIDLVMGFVFYLLACQAKEKKEEARQMDYLNRAIQYASIHAAQSMLHHLLMQEFSDISKQIELVAAFLYQVEPLAGKHGTPGYLLLADGYLYLVRKGAELEHSDSYDSASFYLWYNLLLAEQNESYSKASIQNAYFGKGLVLSNPYKLETIFEMKAKSEPFIANETKVRAQNQVLRQSISEDELDRQKVLAWLQSRGTSRSIDLEMEGKSYTPPK